MGKKDSFDLDLQVSKNGGTVNPRILTSYALCTPGTCHNGCNTNTMASHCCVTKTCLTCA
ncbi:FDLD family class I lanthipeptide [Bacillus cereus]|nr:FDLD family class I lanthipeptide [Bacillus cereus]MDA1766868.1 FDLD family class I lanthipeptide [Bacillus cereus]